MMPTLQEIVFQVMEIVSLSLLISTISSDLGLCLNSMTIMNKPFLAKLYEIILDKKINTWPESHEKELRAKLDVGDIIQLTAFCYA